jgi:glyoxylase-like metal-dependent hydrolase (beta-lactamase superfamily II)
LTISQQRGFYPAGFRLEACAADGIDDGATLDLGGCTLTAIATPGHADGHLSFLVEDRDGRRTLLAGDLVFPGGRVVLQPLPDCRLDELWESLARVRALAPDALYAGHCEPVETGASDHLDVALAAFASGGIPEQLET